jgi:hypothetical protein
MEENYRKIVKEIREGRSGNGKRGDGKSGVEGEPGTDESP